MVRGCQDGRKENLIVERAGRWPFRLRNGFGGLALAPATVLSQTLDLCNPPAAAMGLPYMPHGVGLIRWQLW